MLSALKRALYFPVARYFGFLARIRLNRWGPRIVVVTGSNGKTTALHMLEARLGEVARYTHHRNSSFGIPFDILGLEDASGSRLRWVVLALQAPFFAFASPREQELYVVEADCDRPGEGRFLSELLKPEVVVWLSSARTHSMYYERAGAEVDDAIAHEYGYFLRRAQGMAIINADDARIKKEAEKSSARVYEIGEAQLGAYKVSTDGSTYDLDGRKYMFPYLLPREVFRAIVAANEVAKYFGIEDEPWLENFEMPPGRSSLFRGIKNTTLIDSSYNANTASVAAVLAIVQQLFGTKWLIFGDMIEQGRYSKEEHGKVAELILQGDFARVFLVGPRTRRYVLPILKEGGVAVESFTYPGEVLKKLQSEIAGGEILVFKGARFLEAVVEGLLADAHDAEKLCRREPVWQKRRKEWGL